MKKIVERPKILIVYGYHPKETFAAKVGEYLLHHYLSFDVRVVKYTGGLDRKTSTYYLRRFIKGFTPVILPIILHGDDDMEWEAALIYSARTKQEKKGALKPLLNFCFHQYSKGDNLVVAWGRFFTPSTNYSIIDIELNSKIGLEGAVNLVKDFSQYLLDLYSKKELKL